MYEEIRKSARAALLELLDVAALKPGQQVVVGCSLSEMAKAKALEKALNSGNAQGETKVVKYDHENGLDSKAEKVYEEVFKKDKTKIEASTELKTITARGQRPAARSPRRSMMRWMTRSRSSS